MQYLLNPGDVGMAALDSLECRGEPVTLRFMAESAGSKTLEFQLPDLRLSLGYGIVQPRNRWFAPVTEHPPYICRIGLQAEAPRKLQLLRDLLARLASQFGRRPEAFLSGSLCALYGVDRDAELRQWTTLGASLLQARQAGVAGVF